MITKKDRVIESINNIQDDIFEKILELALKGKLILWAGAGLSMEAGYPSGKDLAKLLLDSLPEEERIALSNDLMKVSDYYVNRNNDGRQELIRMLRKIFLKNPLKSESHEVIKKMAFFKTIITTNYDETFEQNISDLEIIQNTKQLSRSKSNTRKLIKIHGDLKKPKGLILTEGDYSKLYRNDNSDPFWAKLSVELTEKSVLFIGYGFNDPNVRGLFDYLHKKLKRHKNPKFLVAPNLALAEQVKLDNYGIKYFDNTGKDFLIKLYEVWKTKGFKYFGSKEVSTDDLINSLKNEGLPIAISLKGDGRLINYESESNIEWNLSISTFNEKIKQEISEWNKGFGPDDLNIAKSSIDKATMKIGDFVVGDKSTIPELKFTRVGKVYNNVRVFFEKSGAELEGLLVRIHQYGETGRKIIVKNNHGSLSITLPEIKISRFEFNINFIPTEPCNSIAELLKWHEVIYSLGSGDPYTIISNDLPNGFRDANGANSKNLEGLLKNRLIFQVIRQIEEKFKIRFSNLFEKDIFNTKTLETLQIFYELFRTNRFCPETYALGLPVKSISDNPLQDVIPMVNEASEDGYLILNLPEKPIDLLNHKLYLGESQVFFTNPILEEVSDNPEEFLLKSKNNEVFQFFKSFGLPVLKGKK